jgi:molybdopterin-containing oxidoreductase family iron-sulfur binding subunit
VRLRGTRGQGTAFLLSHANSPSRDRLLTELKNRVPNARFYSYEAVDLSVDQQAATVAFGKPVRPYYKLDQASTILSLDCDFIGSEEDTARLIKGFSKSRRSTKPEDPLSRLYVVEGLMTQTGANADHRLRIAPSQIAAVAAALAEKLLGTAGAELTTALKKAGGLDEKTAKWVNQCAAELAKDENRASPSCSPGIASRSRFTSRRRRSMARSAMPARLSSITMFPARLWPRWQTWDAMPAPRTRSSSWAAIQPTTRRPNGRRSRRERQSSSGLLRGRDGGCPAAGSWHLPLAHYLESWGDARTSDGTVVPVQPLLAPLFGSMTELEMFARLAGLPSNPYDIARDTFRAELQRLSPNANFEEEWKKFSARRLSRGQRGQARGGGIQVPRPRRKRPPSRRSIPLPRIPSKWCFTAITRSNDGRYNNNGWLQDCPIPSPRWFGKMSS